MTLINADVTVESEIKLIPIYSAIYNQNCQFML
jgi:hypothetical protein